MILKYIKPTLSLTLATFVVTVGAVFLVGLFGLGLSVLLALAVGMALGGTSSAVVYSDGTRPEGARACCHDPSDRIRVD